VCSTCCDRCSSESDGFVPVRARAGDAPARLAGLVAVHRYAPSVARASSNTRAGAPASLARAVEESSQAFVDLTLAAVAAEGGVSMPQLRALLALERSGPVNLSAFAASIDSSLPSASRLVGRLEEAGLIQRGVSKRSRREVEIRMTASGRGALTALRAARRKEIARVLRRLDAASADRLASALESFATAYGEPA
jgi:DNA-binding MarR family transcriptional regulator